MTEVNRTVFREYPNTWEPESDREGIAAVVDQLTVEIEYSDEGPCLAIGTNDTLGSDYAGGPCAGFERMVTVRSMAALTIASYANSPGDPLELAEWYRDWAEWLDQEAALLRSTADSLSKGAGK